MDDLGLENISLNRRDFIKSAGLLGGYLLLPPGLRRGLYSFGESVRQADFLNRVKYGFPQIIPAPSVPETPLPEAEYERFVGDIIRSVPPTHDRKEGKPLSAGIGYATDYNDEAVCGIPTAMYHAYCAVFRARMDNITPDLLPPRLKYMFSKGKLNGIFNRLWEKDAQIQDILSANSFTAYIRKICTPEEFTNNILIPEKSALLAKPDPKEQLLSGQVMSLGATPTPLVLGEKYLAYEVVPSANNTFIRTFIGVTLAVDVPWGPDEKKLDNMKYNTPPWDKTPHALPWIYDASRRLFNAITPNGKYTKGGRPGLLLISETVYRKYHQL